MSDPSQLEIKSCKRIQIILNEHVASICLLRVNRNKRDGINVTSIDHSKSL